MNLSKKALLAASFLAFGAASGQAQFIIDVDSGGAVSDMGTGVYNFTFTVPELTGTLEDVNLRLSFSYEHAGFGPGNDNFGASDLSASLIAPNGNSTQIFFNDAIALETFEFNDTLFSDGAVDGSFWISSPAGPGPFDPAGNFNNTFTPIPLAALQGTWTLRITDSVTGIGDTGQLTFNAADGQGTELILTGVTAVPEPTTYAFIFGLGALGFAAARRFRKA